jgi:membrane-associated protein
MEFIKLAIDFVLHMNKYLDMIIQSTGNLTYLILFFVIFIETGLVVTPFLPGDSLLFAAGTFAGMGSLNIWVLFFSLAAAAILGDTANYWIGHKLGDRVFDMDSKLIKREYLEKTQAFYEKHGGKTIFLARFIPIIRTFAPFIAGVGKMRYGYFITYNFVGGLVWTALMLFTGYFFGTQKFVQDNFSFVIIAIVVISVFPAVVEWLRNRKSQPPVDKDKPQIDAKID